MPEQETLTPRSFAEDMSELAASHRTSWEQRATNNRPTKTWFAADMTLDPSGDFMTGTLGYIERQEQREFDPDAWSWVKGATHEADTASERTVAPFAVDLRDSERWVAFAATGGLQAGGFAFGLEHVLNQAVIEAGLMPTEWEVDLITSRARVDDWLRAHPRVFLLRRTIKFTNPGRDLDDDRQEMRALAARRKAEEFAAHYGGTLDTNADEFSKKLDGTETGDLDLIMKAREPGVRQETFNSRESADQTQVEDFGADLMTGMEIVLAALREYVTAKQEGSLGQDHLDEETSG